MACGLRRPDRQVATACGRLFDPNFRVKNQRYCGGQACQRARKQEWQKQKLAVDRTTGPTSGAAK